MTPHESEATVSANPVELYRSEEEVRQRLERMTAEECWKLYEVARLYADGLPITTEELLHDAFVAAATRRAWRVDLELSVYFTGVLRSLASAQRKAQRVNALDLGLKQDESERARRLDTVPNPHSDDPAELAEEADDEVALRTRLSALFAGDPEVLRTIEGRARGEQPEEIRAAMGVTAAQYETICRRGSTPFSRTVELRH